jgi:hypothetical protein
MFQFTDKAEQTMNATKGKLMLAAIALAIGASASITQADDQPVVYGRAGIPVAEQRIQQLSHLKASDSASTGNQTVTWYGRAGYAVGADAVKIAPPPTKAYAAGQTKTPTVYGRAGYPLPFTN